MWLPLLAILIGNVDPAHALMPRCQVQGKVSNPAGKTVTAVSVDLRKETMIAEAVVAKDGSYEISFGSTQRHSFPKIVVRLLDAKKKTLKEVTLFNEEPGKTCANTVDF